MNKTLLAIKFRRENVMRIDFKVIRKIASAVAKYYGLDVETLGKGARTERIVWPRHVSRYAAFKLTGASYAEIARCFKCDHGSIRFACQRVQDLCSIDKQLKSEIQVLTTRIGKLI